MRKRIPKLLVAGGAGFIGSEFVRLCAGKGHKVIVVDKLTYAGDLKRLGKIRKEIKFYKADICDKEKIGAIFQKERPEYIVNFAAETHVDRSIRDSTVFFETNILGAKVLLDSSIKYGVEKVLHLSSDETYGEIQNGEFLESFPLRPNSPYSASKAAADLLISSYIRTFNLPAIIIRPSNNYGPWQYPEKLIPLAILKILRKEKIPVYADGKNVREWLFVADSARGVLAVMEKGRIGEVYNLGSNEEMRNIDVVGMILNILGASMNMIQFVKDRPGHDKRYRLNSEKIYNETGWMPEFNLERGLKATVQWCVDNQRWLMEKWNNVAPLYKTRQHCQ